jgi:phosphopantothenoylcysteine decarboxylase/phosphopantothenate--cysteine ligase
MNVRMWEHPATRRNVTTLRADGIHFIGPDEGEMACGEYGSGRMAEPEAIVAEVDRLLSAERRGPLTGRHVLITSGPTHEPLDPVRYIANRSSGKQGHALARAAVDLGARVTLVSGPVNLPAPQAVTTLKVETAQEMLDAVLDALPADIAICAAAVADWRAASEAGEKIKKEDGEACATLALTENPDILATISVRGPQRPELVIGFAAETENVVAYAQKKRRAKGADWIVANDVSAGTGVMGGDRTQVHLVTGQSVDAWPAMSKDEMAARLLGRASEALARVRTAAE